MLSNCDGFTDLAKSKKKCYETRNGCVPVSRSRAGALVPSQRLVAYAKAKCTVSKSALHTKGTNDKGNGCIEP